ISTAAASTLDAAAQIIQAQPGLRVLIAGHADATGSVSFNEELSRDRAEAVRGYLIEQGIAANRLLVVAYGELFPSATGARSADRRVEFEVAG
ncbi:MAG: OmpA family protein, partial [bacterium]|nr:OmpA family protein [bacterium]